MTPNLFHIISNPQFGPTLRKRSFIHSTRRPAKQKHTDFRLNLSSSHIFLFSLQIPNAMAWTEMNDIHSILLLLPFRYLMKTHNPLSDDRYEYNEFNLLNQWKYIKRNTIRTYTYGYTAVLLKESIQFNVLRARGAFFHIYIILYLFFFFSLFTSLIGTEINWNRFERYHGNGS